MSWSYLNTVCPKCGNDGMEINEDENVRCQNCSAFYNDLWELNSDYSDPGNDGDYYDIEDDIPEGCQACGGPYPDCTTSCKLFDD